MALTVMSAAAAASGADAQPLRLPLTLLRNNPVTTFEVSGRELRIGVDTGGGMLGLTADALAIARAVEIPSKAVTWTDSRGGTHNARRYRVPGIRLGGREFADLEAIEAEEIPDGPAVANVIGRDLLSRFVVVIDYAGGAMTLLPRQTSAADLEASGCVGSRVPFEKATEPGLVVVRVGLDGAMFTLGVDTGAQYSALREDVVATRPLPLTPAAGDRPPFYPARHAVVGGNDLGTLEFVVLPLQLPRGIDGVLGYNFFTGHVVCLDYERGELRVR